MSEVPYNDGLKRNDLACIIYKSSDDYQDSEILNLMPAQDIHSPWMFECVVRNQKDFDQLKHYHHI